ncbi:MAG: hypothetical protein GY793_08185, partial [Proteobacteria bacterium]|nr:hypothetical protein [Pseudomonadota bacterium]
MQGNESITLVALIKNRIMNISKEQFTKLAKEHLLALESYKMDKNGNKPIE